MKVKQVIKNISGKICIDSFDIVHECVIMFRDVGDPLCGECEHELEGTCQAEKCTNYSVCQECERTDCLGVTTRTPRRAVWTGYASDLPIKFLDCTVENIKADNISQRKKYSDNVIRIEIKEFVR